MRNRLVLGNWKLNGGLAQNTVLLAQLASKITLNQEHKERTCGVCVPYAYLSQVQTLLTNTSIHWGSQDVSRFESGAYSGEVSASMVAEFKSRFALVGHSERRAIFGDTDEFVAQKFGAAKKAGLMPVLCVGETLEERAASKTGEVVTRQLNAVIAAYGVAALQGAVLAYEPVWAIGTGKTATPAEAESVHQYLRRYVANVESAGSVKVADALPILYGGSVKKSNAAELFAMPNIDGGLIGGASLVADEFLGIWASL